MRLADFKDLASIAQMLSGAILYCGSVAILELLSGPNRLVSALIFTSLVPLAFVVLTIVWHKLTPTYRVPPSLSIAIGSVILIPVFFVTFFPWLYGPRLLDVWEIVTFLFASYMLFPVVIISISSYTFTIGGLTLAIMATLVAGSRMAKSQTQPA